MYEVELECAIQSIKQKMKYVDNKNLNTVTIITHKMTHN